MPDVISPEALKLLAYSAEGGGFDYLHLENQEILGSLIERGLVTTQVRSGLPEFPFLGNAPPELVGLLSFAFLATLNYPAEYVVITPVGEKYLAQHKDELESRIY